MYCVPRLVFLVSALGAAHAQLSGKLLCPKPLAETLLTSIIGGLLLEGRIPPGNVINAGANEGAYACWYAQLAPERLVHAIDPDLGHIENMRDRFGAALPNLQPMVGALGDTKVESVTRNAATKHSLTLFPRAKRKGGKLKGAKRKGAEGAEGASTFSIFRVDDLAAVAQPIGYMHYDVEDREVPMFLLILSLST